MSYKYGGSTQNLFRACFGMTEAAYEDGSNREHERLYQWTERKENVRWTFLARGRVAGGWRMSRDISIFTYPMTARKVAKRSLTILQS